MLAFQFLRGDREPKSLITYIQEALVRGTEAVVSPGNAADRSEATAEIWATNSTVQAQAQESRGSEAGWPDATRDSTDGAASMLREPPATVPQQAAEAAHDTDPAWTHATEPMTAATAVPAATEFLKTAPEAHDIASAGPLEPRIGLKANAGGAGGWPSRDRSGRTAGRSPPARPRSGRPAPVPRIAEIAPEDPRFKTMAADALVTRGDTFFAAGDLASARLFYEHAVAAGNAVAALRLGGTFDPGFLARAGIGRVQGDAAIALYWYRQARDLGNSNAEILLKKMEKLAK